MPISNGFKKYFYNTSWLLFERIARTIIQVIIGVIVTRYQGPSRFGLLSYAGSYIGIFAAITSLGMDNIVVQMLVQSPDQRKSILSTALILRIISGSVSVLLIMGAVFLTNEDPQSRLLILIVSLTLIIQAFNVFDFHFQAKVASKYFVYASMFQNLGSSLLRIICVLLHASLVWFAWLTVIEAFLLAVGLAYYYYKTEAVLFFWEFHGAYAKEILRRSWPLILATVAVTVYMRIDQIMIKKMMDESAVGFYAAAVRLSEGWWFLTTIISASVFPAMIKAKLRSEKLFQECMQALYSILTWLFIALAVPIALFSNTIVVLLLGKAFAPAGNVLAIHIWSVYFVFLGVANGRWLVIENLQMIDFVRTLLGAVVNIILNIVFIPRYGIQGAAIATLAAQFVSSYLIFGFFKKGRRILMLTIKAMIPRPALIRRLMTISQ